MHLITMDLLRSTLSVQAVTRITQAWRRVLDFDVLGNDLELYARTGRMVDIGFPRLAITIQHNLRLN